jgi:hypothetical protein
MREGFVFRHFFTGMAIGGALAEWLVVCWFIRRPPVLFHVIVPIALAVVNRLAARRLQREPATGLFAGRGGAVVLATAFTAMVSVGVLTTMGGAWAALRLLGAFSAEAGVPAGSGIDHFFGGGFYLLGTLAIGATAVAMVDGYVRGYRRLVVTRLTVPVPDLPPALAALRVVHLSDLHLGPLANRVALREAFARVASLAPDVICVTGDLVDSVATDLDAWIPELARLHAPLGVFAILGNHDVHVGADRVANAVRRSTAWRLLRDEIATVEVDGARLHLIGLEDRRAEAAAPLLPDLLARIPPDEPAILLAHRPSIFPAAAAAGLRIVLAGHTHGGQLAVPGLSRLNIARALITSFDAGSFVRDGAVLHVNRGLGTSGQRVRVGVPREITLVTFVPSAARAA